MRHMLNSGYPIQHLCLNSQIPSGKESYVPCSERRKEIKRRRHRRVKMAQWIRQLKSAKVSERTLIAEKIRALTPGADIVIANLGLDES